MNRNILVGLFLIGGTVVFGAGLFLLGNRQKTFSRHFEVYAEFANVSSLESGANVRVSGLDAGEVLSIQVPPKPSGKFRVKVRLDQKDHSLVRTDSKAVILTEGLVGNKYLEVQKGSDDAEEARDGATIQSAEPFDFSDLMQNAAVEQHQRGDPKRRSRRAGHGSNAWHVFKERREWSERRRKPARDRRERATDYVEPD